MQHSGRSNLVGRIIAAVLLLSLVFVLVVGANSRDPKPDPDKSKPWYRGKENLEKFFLTKRDLPRAPLIDYAQDCMLCHNVFYDQWSNSGHATSYNNAFFQDAWQDYNEWKLNEDDVRAGFDDMARYDGSLDGGMDEMPEWGLELTKTDCLSCHAPSINAAIKYTEDLELRNVLLAMREGYIPTWEDIVSGYFDTDLEYEFGSTRYDEQIAEPSLDIATRKQIRYLQRISDYTKDGISCDFCHTITRVSLVQDRDDDLHRMHNMNYSLNYEHRFGMKKWGSIEETPTASHTIQYSPVYEQSEFCAPCHQEVNDFGIKVQDTYNEWKGSSWARQGITCQSCHMPEFRSVVSKHGPIRNNAHDHSMLGIDDPAFMLTAADLGILAFRTGDGDYVDVTVSIDNNGTGHALPTGIPFRRVVLVVRAKDELGNIFWDARQLNLDTSYLRNLPEGYWNDQGDYPTFQRKLGSSYPSIFEDTNELPYWMADLEIEDTRIMPGEVRTLKFYVPTSDIPGSVFVTAQLFYRRASTKYANYFDLVDYPELIAGAATEVR